MDRNEFKAMAQNNPTDALMHLFDECEAAELELASIREEETELEGEVQALEKPATETAPAA